MELVKNFIIDRLIIFTHNEGWNFAKHWNILDRGIPFQSRQKTFIREHQTISLFCNGFQLLKYNIWLL